MIRKCIAHLVVLLIACIDVSAQRGNIWYFGYNAGIDFNQQTPVPLTDGKLRTNEGRATICDQEGKLLFFTDGVTVYNRKQDMMMNGTGLLGHLSSTQSAVSVPWPGKSNLYYITTAGEITDDGKTGYNYSIIDIEEDNGQGKIIQKNRLPYSPGTEKLTVAAHRIGIDWWIVTKEVGTNLFKCYLVDENGINMAAVVSDAGVPYRDHSSIGCMKVSPDGKKLAVSYWTIEARDSYSQLLDFDNEQGIVDHAVTIWGPANYGIEFSPDSRFLYISCDYRPFRSSVEQFDLSAYSDSASLEATIRAITEESSAIFGMQLAPNDKIYIIRSSHALDAINAPNVRGAGCENRRDDLVLGKKAALMLPAMLPGSVYSEPVSVTMIHTVTDSCKRKVDFDVIVDGIANPQYEWDFGNGITSPAKNPWHQFASNKDTARIVLKVTGTINNRIITKTINRTIIFKSLPIPNMLKYRCNNLTTIFLDKTQIATGSVVKWFWDFGDGQTSTEQHPVHTYASYGIKQVKLVVTSNAGCVSGPLTLPVEVSARPTVDYLIPTQACVNTPLTFRDKSMVEDGAITKWEWDFGDGVVSGDKDPVIQFSSAGEHDVSLRVTTNMGCVTHKLVKKVFVKPLPVADFSHTALCVGEPVTFTNMSSSTDGSAMSYLWKVAEDSVSVNLDMTHTFGQPGSYPVSLSVTSNNGCESVPVTKVLTLQSVVANAGPDLAAVAGHGIRLQGSGGVTYQWSPASLLDNPSARNPVATLQRDQAFMLTVTNAKGCSANDQVYVKVYKKADIFVPDAFTPNSDGVNDVLKALPVAVTLQQFSIYNRWGNLVFSTTDASKGWNGVYRGYLQDSGSFVWTASGISVTGEKIVRRGALVLIR